ncbi:MAG: hypothetical protein INR71_06015 [Terriglobus roseus]|nr:hypothetical protein [Terriglobus roseus]
MTSVGERSSFGTGPTTVVQVGDAFAPGEDVWTVELARLYVFEALQLVAVTVVVPGTVVTVSQGRPTPSSRKLMDAQPPQSIEVVAVAVLALNVQSITSGGCSSMVVVQALAGGEPYWGVAVLGVSVSSGGCLRWVWRDVREERTAQDSGDGDGGPHVCGDVGLMISRECSRIDGQRRGLNVED